ncbi:MAG: lysylphosphatidylglycerol synthase transmembrane domain-containing protein, partial [Acidimicrobiales bacterium]
PARAREIARAYMVQRQLPVRFTTAVASIAVERALDGLTLVGLMVLALAAPSFTTAARVGGASLSRLALVGALVFGGALALALVVVLRPAPWMRLLRRVLQRILPPRLADRLLHAAEGLVAGLEVLKAPRRLVEVASWSLGLWLVNAASFWICFRAFDLPVPASGALVLQGLIAIGIAIPAAPGFFGVFEAVTREALALYGVGAEQAVGYAVAYHLSTFVPITLLGLYSLARGHVRLGELRASDAGTPAG